MSSHTGAHADAPLHYSDDGAAIDAVDLAPYLGRCAVVRIFSTQLAIGPEAIEMALERVLGPKPVERVLIRTYRKSPTKWDGGFTAIAAEAINMLARRGCRLIGVDTPSLDPEPSKTMDAHKAVLAANMRVLEGLVLDDVAEGEYELIALPLKLEGLDAAPVRAVLRTLA